MAKKKKVAKIIKLQIPAGKANPAPPIGSALGAAGVNIMGFCKEFNAKTDDLMKKFGGADVKVKVKATVFVDRSFKLEIGSPVTSNLILRKLGEKKGSGVPNIDKVGTIKREQVRKIAEIKMQDLNAYNIEGAMRMIEGTARNMGVLVED